MHLVSILLFCLNIYSENSTQPKEIISVKADILSKGYLLDSPIKNDCYITRFEIIKNEDTAVKVKIWTCSWYRNWRTNNDSIHIAVWACDSNYPESIMIPPKKSLLFLGGIYIWSKSIVKSLKIGFVNCSSVLPDVSDTFPKIRYESKIFWTAPLSIKRNYPKGDNYSSEYFIK